ncbi:hypothetical protein, partial [Saccharothrix sp. ST-888]|uniref:hypothetical protein n=1 Tax=Saccharothrix sp. ST-888 TaxID=1427391 RepID=UPI001E34B88B
PHPPSTKPSTTANSQTCRPRPQSRVSEEPAAVHFNDHCFEDYDDLRSTIVAQLDDIENAPDETRVRIAPPIRPTSRR